MRISRVEGWSELLGGAIRFFTVLIVEIRAEWRLNKVHIF